MPLSPSRLMRTIPEGPSAQGMRNGPAVSQPRALFPASGRTRNCERRRDAFIDAGERWERETSSRGAVDFPAIPIFPQAAFASRQFDCRPLVERPIVTVLRDKFRHVEV